MSYSKNPRGGMPKMMSGPMAKPKGMAHYEAHARGVHRVDTHIQGAPHSAGIKHATGIGNGARMPNPGMGKGKGKGGY